jgi:hypothetical protein
MRASSGSDANGASGCTRITSLERRTIIMYIAGTVYKAMIAEPATPSLLISKAADVEDKPTTPQRRSLAYVRNNPDKALEVLFESLLRS